MELSAKSTGQAGPGPGDMAPRGSSDEQTAPAETVKRPARADIPDRSALGLSSPERNAPDRGIRLRKSNAPNDMGARSWTMPGANARSLAVVSFMSRAPVLQVRTGPGKS
mgnify:CR=1 FL=1